jgi:hypothetical protein
VLMKLKDGLQRITGVIAKLKAKAINIYSRNKVLGVIVIGVWLLSAVILIPILWIIGGIPLVLAYIACKLTGVCPL